MFLFDAFVVFFIFEISALMFNRVGKNTRKNMRERGCENLLIFPLVHIFSFINKKTNLEIWICGYSVLIRFGVLGIRV